MAYIKRDWDNTSNEVTKEDFKRIENGIESNDIVIAEQQERINVLKNKVFIKDITTDFDEALTQGEYRIIGATPILHCPPSWVSGSAHGKLIVTVSDGETHNNQNNWIWQTVYFTDRNLGIWQRQKNNQDEWTDWMLISSITCTPGLLNGWNQYSGHQIVRCIKVGKISYLVGCVAVGAVDGGTLIMSGLPSIFCPKDVYTIVVNTNGNTAELSINENGTIVLRQVAVQIGEVVSFDGICWESY